jgi:hypothetical protein
VEARERYMHISALQFILMLKLLPRTVEEVAAAVAIVMLEVGIITASGPIIKKFPRIMIDMRSTTTSWGLCPKRRKKNSGLP